MQNGSLHQKFKPGFNRHTLKMCVCVSAFLKMQPGSAFLHVQIEVFRFKFQGLQAWTPHCFRFINKATLFLL